MMEITTNQLFRSQNGGKKEMWGWSGDVGCTYSLPPFADLVGCIRNLTSLGRQIVGRSSESRPEAIESLVQPVTAAI